jgi:hypothetical protein
VVVSSLAELHLETKMRVLDVLIAADVFLLVGSLSIQSQGTDDRAVDSGI